MPAEQTSTSTGPSSDVARATAALTCAESDTSPASASAPSGASPPRSSEATFAPSASRRRTVAAPIPLEPPVTSATRPANRSSFVRATPASLTSRRGIRPRHRLPARHAPARSRRDARRGSRSTTSRSPRRVTAAARRQTTRAPPRPRSRLQAAVAASGGRAPSSPTASSAPPSSTAVPDDELLAIYTALRPGRSSAAELEAWAVRLDELGAPRNAAFVREAVGRVRGHEGSLTDG